MRQARYVVHTVYVKSCSLREVGHGYARNQKVRTAHVERLDSCRLSGRSSRGSPEVSCLVRIDQLDGLGDESAFPTCALSFTGLCVSPLLSSLTKQAFRLMVGSAFNWSGLPDFESLAGKIGGHEYRLTAVVPLPDFLAKHVD